MKVMYGIIAQGSSRYVKNVFEGKPESILTRDK